MKRIKKMLCLFIIGILLLPTFVYASQFEVDEYMYIEIDDSIWYVFTRENIKNNKELDTLKISYEYMNNFFKNHNAYLDAFLLYKGTGEMIELTVRKVKSGGKYNFSSSYSDDELLEIVGEILRDKDPTVLELYEKNGYKYVYSEYIDQDNYLMEYYIIINGYSYTISTQKDGEFDTDNKVRVKEIVDSITFKLDDTIEDKPSSDSDGVKTIIIFVVIGGALAAVVIITIMMMKKKNNNNNNRNGGNKKKFIDDMGNGYYGPDQYNGYYNNGNNNYYNNNNNNYY